MAYNELSCTGNGGNTGKQNCVENFGQVQMLLLVPDTYEIDTQANAILEATYNTAINAAVATRMYPLFGHFNAEFDQEGRVPESGWAGKEETVRSGKNKATFIFENISFYNHIELIKHNDRTNLAIYEITQQGYIRGWSKDGIKLLPFTLEDFVVNDRNDHTGDEMDRSSVSITYTDSSQWNKTGVWVKPIAFDPLLLDGIKDASISGVLAATSSTVTVVGASDQVGIVGLVAANFRLYDDAIPGTPIAVTVGTDNGDGTYDLTWSSITGAHTLTLFAQPAGTSFFEAIDEINTTV